MAMLARMALALSLALSIIGADVASGVAQQTVGAVPKPAPVWPTSETPSNKPAASQPKKAQKTSAPQATQRRKTERKLKPVVAQQTKPKVALFILPDPPTPVRHLLQLGLQQCVDVVNKMSRETLNRTYEAQSAWNTEAPTQHTIQSIAVLNSPQSVPPDGLAALIATPTPNGSCDGVTVQIFPLAGDCRSVEKQMVDNGGKSSPLLDARLIFDKNRKRLLLLPGFAKTCIAVTVDSTFGESK